MFATRDRDRLLTIARTALEARVRGEAGPEPEGGGALDSRCGAFVSIHLRDELRGCLGRLEIDWAVSHVVAHLGRAVADSDPRFQPVTMNELALLSIEISVLTPEREVRSISEIEIGRHGLIVERGHRRGLLLPQVATEHAWDVHTFLNRTCAKAGLSAEAWQRDARVYLFEAEVFGEANTAGIMANIPL
jgi:AmmeMemoRadiSam system protein A